MLVGLIKLVTVWIAEGAGDGAQRENACQHAQDSRHYSKKREKEQGTKEERKDHGFAQREYHSQRFI